MSDANPTLQGPQIFDPRTGFSEVGHVLNELFMKYQDDLGGRVQGAIVDADNAQQVVEWVRDGKSCSFRGHETSQMALCYDGGYQNGLGRYYWFCPVCTHGEEAQ